MDEDVVHITRDHVLTRRYPIDILYHLLRLMLDFQHRVVPRL